MIFLESRALLTSLLWISGALSYSSSCVCAGFAFSSPVLSVTHVQQQRYTPSRNPNALRFELKRIKSRGTPSTTAIRGESADSDNDGDEVDHGVKVSDIFGNLRIPASLIAGAALASAFEMPLADTDGLKLGAVKRIYSLAMLNTLSSMLLTVLVSTMCMHDIDMCPPRPAKYVKDYIEKHYALEWMLMKINFIWGNIIFVSASMLRGWVFLKSPIIGDGVLGIMGSLLLVSVSILVEFTNNQTGRTPMQQIKRNISLVLDKTKTNRMFAVSILTWVATVIYLIAKVPYIYFQLTSP